MEEEIATLNAQVKAICDILNDLLDQLEKIAARVDRIEGHIML